MAKDLKVYSTLNPNISHDDSSDDDVDDESKKLGLWLASLDGETKEKVNALLDQLDEANSLIDEKEDIIITLESNYGVILAMINSLRRLLRKSILLDLPLKRNYLV